MEAAPVKMAMVEELVPEAAEAALVEVWQTPLLQETATLAAGVPLLEEQEV